jgi:acetyltransferase-like isoleucine patch superfamily enzyme
VLVRAVLTTSALQEGRFKLSEPAYFTWWLLVNLQMVFNRFPALEEALRLVPTLYSNWLRLFGARIGRFTYWAAGTRILDRSFLDIGDGVVFGAGTCISPHLVVRNRAGEPELCLARVKIGDRAIIGGYSTLAAGTEIAADECTRACLLSPPFSTWAGGRRVSKANDADA